MTTESMFDSIAVIGPTASGKTNLAVSLAHQLNGEILSVDSRMVFKGMDIGTGKDLDSYYYQGKPIPYHLIDICEPSENYNIHRFQTDFKKAFHLVRTEKKLPILCGGSGLYLEAVINDFAYTSVPTNIIRRAELETLTLEELNNILNGFPYHDFLKLADPTSHKRAVRAIEIMEYLMANPSFALPISEPIKPFVIGINPSTSLRWQRINNRLEQRLNNGLIEEIVQMRQLGITKERLIFFGLEYKYVLNYLEEKWSKEKLFEELSIAIRQFSKRQMTYFRKMEKGGLHIHWVEEANEVFSILPEQFTQIKN